eukprot:TRINITY_DN5240_c0_g1_i4.p1 TRINITY_DN5240_c0_g1~~TRINITY_DN5240_c0_g1_i4.p1  ORF type:complete len:375 (-),score=90.66 TRINITY_DN5240_c0_g1_i4:373-1497(-)
MQRTPSGADTPNHDRTGSSDMSDAKAKLKALKQSLVQTGEKMKQSIKKGLESLAADEDFDHDPSENIDSPPAVLTPVNGGGSTGSAMEDAKFERMNSSGGVPTLTPKKSFNSEDAKILETIRAERFSKLIEETDVDMTKIRKLCWSSIPAQHRPLYWPVLLGVLPFNKARRETIVDKRIKEYMWFCKIHQNNWPDKYTVEEMKSFKQIELDIPRTAPRANMFFHQRMEKALSRVLTIYSIRHPATGYVQGMNDVVIPWLWIFATECTQKFEDEDKSEAIDRMDRLSEDHWNAIEAKTFWCFSRAVESIQDHYTRDQPGIQKKLFQLKQLMGQIDPELNTYLEEAGITYHMFAQWRAFRITTLEINRESRRSYFN